MNSSGGGNGGSGGAGGGAMCDPPADPPVFDIGTGETCFETLESGQEIPLMNGPQGGYHVWLAIGCEDCGSQVTLKYGARDPLTNATFKGTESLQAVYSLSGADFPQHAGIVVGMPGLSWDPEYDPPPAKGTHILLWAEAYEAGLLKHQAEVEIVIGDILYWDPCPEDPDNPICGQFG